MKNKTLYEKFRFGDELLESGERYYPEKDLKQTIKEVMDEIEKDKLTIGVCEVNQIIKSKFGKELVE